MLLRGFLHKGINRLMPAEQLQILQPVNESSAGIRWWSIGLRLARLPARQRFKFRTLGGRSGPEHDTTAGHAWSYSGRRFFYSSRRTEDLPEAFIAPDSFWTIATLILILRNFITVLYDLDHPTLETSSIQHPKSNSLCLSMRQLCAKPSG
jgi:hypothetical protein